LLAPRFGNIVTGFGNISAKLGAAALFRGRINDAPF